MADVTTKWSPTIDDRNRLNPLNPDREGAMTDNPHMQTMYDIRSKLKLALNEVPDCPRVNSMDELFTKAEEVVHGNWQKHVSELFNQHRTEWLKEVEGKEEYKELHDILSNDKLFEQKMRLFQLGPLEPLRTIAPDAWYKLLLAQSERQLAQIWLMNHWLKQQKEELPKSMKMTPDEVKLTLEIGNLAKYFNVAFLKQTELADTPGGSSATPLAGVQGADSLYEVYENPTDEEYKLKTFGEVFKSEWGKIVEHLKRLSGKTADLITAGKIPESYKGLPEHLNLVAEVYGSKEKDPEKIAEMWKELDKSCKALGDSGCPISIIGQAVAMVAGEANKVDVEFRVGLRNEKAQSLEGVMKTFHESAQSIVDAKADALTERVTLPVPQVTRQIYSFGTDLIWETPADTRPEATNIHYNTIAKEGMAMKPILDQLLPENPITEKEYRDAFVLDTTLHELGHGILPVEDSNIVERVGTTSEADIMEELKAETASFVILRDAMKKGGDVNIRSQALAKMSVILDYLLNKSSEEGGASERYYYTGIAIVQELLDQGALQEKNGVYSIKDPGQVVEIIAGMGDTIIKEYYENKDSNPERVTEKGRELRLAKLEPKVAAFLKAIQTIQNS